jgi:hypothetical protein
LSFFDFFDQDITLKKASNIIFLDIFEDPKRRSIKVIGVSKYGKDFCDTK